MDLKNMVELEKDNIKSGMEIIGDAREVVIQCEFKMLKKIGSTVSVVSYKLDRYGDRLVEVHASIEKAIQENRTKTNAELQ
jgi:hypothetical protein